MVHLVGLGFTQTMTKRTFTAAILSLGAALILTTPARADTLTSLSRATTTARTDTTSSLRFHLPARPRSALLRTQSRRSTVTGVTISGTFGNGDNPTTALSDYYLGFSGNEEAVEVAGCDSILADCYSNQNGPTAWSYTLTAANLSTLASAIAGGSLDFTYTWDNNTQFAFSGYDQYVYAGRPRRSASVHPTVTPEPASVAALFLRSRRARRLRRFRRV